MSYTSRIIMGNVTSITVTIAALTILSPKSGLWTHLMIGAVVLVVTSVVLGIISAAAFKPLAGIITALEQAAAGDLSVRSDVKGKGDFARLASAFNCTRAQVFTKILLPAALPFVIVGLRLGIGRALTGVVVGELFASRAGVGYLISSAGLSFDTATVFLGVLVFSLMGVLLMEGLKMLEHRLAPWRKSVQEVR